MNNKELSKRFDKIDELDNSLDVFAELTKLKKEYQKSNFYKTTKLNVYRAYEFYHKLDLVGVINKFKNLLNPDNLSNFIQQTVDNLEPDTILRFAEKIGEVFNLNSLQPQQENLQELVEQLKTFK